MQVHGRCHCGNISFSAKIDPSDISVCHCSDCQTFSGAPFRASVKTAASNVQFEGQANEYVKTADSGNQRVQGFCGQCGTNLYATALNDRSILGLRLGCIAERSQLIPTLQMWGQSAMPWVQGIEAGPRHKQGPDSEIV